MTDEELEMKFGYKIIKRKNNNGLIRMTFEYFQQSVSPYSDPLKAGVSAAKFLIQLHDSNLMQVIGCERQNQGWYNFETEKAIKNLKTFLGVK